MHSQFGKRVVALGSYQSGQMGLTVTQLSFDFGGSNPSLPTNESSISDKRNFCGKREQKQNLFWLCRVKQKSRKILKKFCGSSSVDRALAFQAEGRGFEPRLPL